MTSAVRSTLFACSLLLAAACATSRPATLSAADLAAVTAADRAYATAWLAGEPDAVMATLTDEPVLVPSGLPPLFGAEAARAFWFPPDSPPTVVTRFDLEPARVEGSGDVAWVQGSFTLAFEYDGTAYTSGGQYVSVLRRQPDGTWRIATRMWSDRPR